MKRCLRHAAFTLVEIVVAVGITAVLAALSLTIVTHTLGIWEKSASALTMENRAQLVMDRLVVDWESAVVRRDGGEWIRWEGTNHAVTELRLFTNTRTTSGDAAEPHTIREVVYVTSSGADGRKLYRWEGTASAALTSGYAFSDPVAVTSIEFLITEGLMELTLEWFDEDGVVIDTPTPANWPALTKISVTLISELGAQRLAAVANGDSAEPIDDIQRDTTQTYTRWVNFPGRPW
ncbi:PulJ/GspJ family protein [Synoicihabitans lomoniglobus]|uniref:Prepilin-type N-terminal cleavage/methylation domain-containing protein n=1 Tax=Synoicihabitans lomoniglobus TaxID=2909285 RepID=A0AAF0CS68_9BACT|nr:prepilin-type N-terminal cleavage/methylation domain-containing protein [Opitutaceae bacterium LMO-M01]WED67115.1 prepilin-type N-terminal cleavage/methylation domain-containing protein [Opitutaceae bacterium LMO-M01]